MSERKVLFSFGLFLLVGFFSKSSGFVEKKKTVLRFTQRVLQHFGCEGLGLGFRAFDPNLHLLFHDVASV